MKIGITGHQEREGIDWRWVRSLLKKLLAAETKLIGYSSLAAGTDQVFAEALLSEGGQLIAVIPLENYVSFFKDEALKEYQRLLTFSNVIELKSTKQDEQAFLDAGKWIVRRADRIVAVWDGEQAEGKGGTGDIVAYAISLNKPVVHINPIGRKITDL